MSEKPTIGLELYSNLRVQFDLLQAENRKLRNTFMASKPASQMTNNLCSLKSATRQVIKHGNTVAILASKQDLEDMIYALSVVEGSGQGRSRRIALAAAMGQLLVESFPDDRSVKDSLIPQPHEPT